MYHFIYKTINIINGKYYIGAHSTYDINDDYFGSGVALKLAISKYGKINFVREILEYCLTYDELYLREEQIIKECLNDVNCYNMNCGGRGGWFFVNSTDVNIGDNNIMRRCPELKNKIIEKMKKTKLENKEYYAEISRINGKKAIEKCTGVKCPQKGNSDRSKKHWKDNYQKMRDSLSSYFEVVSPEGVITITNRLQEFCKINKLTYVSLWNTSRTNKVVKKGKARGWICRKI